MQGRMSLRERAARATRADGARRRSPARRATLIAAFGLIVAPDGAAAAPGALDPRFGLGGIVSTPTAPGAGEDWQGGLALQRDGKVLVGGVSYIESGDGGFQWRITRYRRDGALDPTFGTGGTVLTSMSSVGGFDERLTSLDVQRDGRIVAAGWSETTPGSQDSALARFNADGTLDTSFGAGGRAFTSVASEPDHDFINQVLVDGRGRIVVAGGCRRAFVGRYLRDGTLDPSFNAAGPRPGLALTELAPADETNAEILGLAIDLRGRIVGAGYSTVLENGSQQANSAVARFLPSGALDPSFNPTGPRPGTVITPVSPGFDVAFRVALDHWGRILTVGDTFVGVGAGLFDIALSRYTRDGRLDSSFGTGGTVVTNAGPGDSDDDAQGLAVQLDGKILVGGSAAPTAFTFDSDFMVARFRSSGVLDPTFGDGGIATTPTAPGTNDDEIYAMALQGPSKLVASGECDRPATGRDVCVARYDLGLTLFGHGG